jgi:glycosyltransferase involved in cell wall biosynthesis
MSRYKLSIITINLNNLQGLKRTVESVINQTYREFEYIIIDGASNDGSAEYIREMQKYIHYSVSQPDNGIYNAMNYGIEVMTGEYLLFLNSGDEFFENRGLENIIHLIDDYVVYYADGVGIREDGTLKKIYTPDRISLTQFYIASVPHSGLSIIPKLFFDKYGYYDTGYKYSSDWLWFLQRFIEGVNFIKIPGCELSKFEMFGVSSSSNARNERRILIEKFDNIFRDTSELVVFKQTFKCLLRIYYRVKKILNV